VLRRTGNHRGGKLSKRSDAHWSAITSGSLYPKAARRTMLPLDSPTRVVACCDHCTWKSTPRVLSFVSASLAATAATCPRKTAHVNHNFVTNSYTADGAIIVSPDLTRKKELVHQFRKKSQPPRFRSSFSELETRRAISHTGAFLCTTCPQKRRRPSACKRALTRSLRHRRSMTVRRLEQSPCLESNHGRVLTKKSGDR
jgi:hypothetical protein